MKITPQVPALPGMTPLGLPEHNKVHPFLSTLGEGPYQFTGCYDLGAAQDPNSAANFGNMRGWFADAPKLKAGLGTCAHCGMAISLICIVRIGNGDLYGVGSDCIEKIDDPGLTKGVKATIALRRSEQRRVKLAARRQAQWLADAPRREQARLDAIAREERELRERDERSLANAHIIAAFFYGDDYLARANAGEFPVRLHPYNRRWEIDYSKPDHRGWQWQFLASWLNGIDPKVETPRAKSILCEIRAKDFGRVGSKDYTANYDRLANLIGLSAE